MFLNRRAHSSKVKWEWLILLTYIESTTSIHTKGNLLFHCCRRRAKFSIGITFSPSKSLKKKMFYENFALIPSLYIIC